MTSADFCTALTAQISPGKNAVLPRTTAPFTCATKPYGLSLLRRALRSGFAYGCAIALGRRCVWPARLVASAFYEVLVHRLAGLAYSSFSAAVARAALTSAGIFMSMFSSCVGSHTGDLNPIRTAPMLGTPKRMQATARRLSVVSATSCARRRLIRSAQKTESIE